MKRLKQFLILSGFMFVFAVSGNAAVFTFIPDPADLYDLDHHLAYTWGIEWEYTNMHIVDAILTFRNIRDYMPEPDDILYTNLLDNPYTGVTVYSDVAPSGNYFDGPGVLVNTWSDPDDGTFPADMSFSLRDLGYIGQLNDFAADGLFGFGFDPDCHYYNDGVELTIITSIPEPATIFLIGIGAIGLAAYRRRR
jgi:hypothetical protein